MAIAADEAGNWVLALILTVGGSVVGFIIATVKGGQRLADHIKECDKRYEALSVDVGEIKNSLRDIQRVLMRAERQ